MIGIGVLGCANIAIRTMIPEILLNTDLNLISIASRIGEKSLKYANIFNCNYEDSYQKLLDRNDIDAVYIPLPTGLHYEWVKKALLSNKHVFCEKSLVSDFNSGLELIEIAKKKNLLLMENYMFKYHSQHIVINKIISNNEIGSIRLFKSNFGFPPLTKDNFRYNKDLGGGSLLDAGGYTINAARMYLGDKLSVLSSNLYTDDNNIDIFGSATLISKNENILANISFGFDNSYQCNYEIWGSKGTIYCNKAFTPNSTTETKIILENSSGVSTIINKPDNQFRNILQEFVRSINNKDYNVHYDEILNQSKIQHDIKTKSNIYKYLS
jgi:predicted dehydrogenase